MVKAANLVNNYLPFVLSAIKVHAEAIILLKLMSLRSVGERQIIIMENLQNNQIS